MLKVVFFHNVVIFGHIVTKFLFVFVCLFVFYLQIFQRQMDAYQGNLWGEKNRIIGGRREYQKEKRRKKSKQWESYFVKSGMPAIRKR